MTHQKPYPRVFLPRKNKGIMNNQDYLSDPCYIDKQESASYVNAARIIIKDYYDLMDYVEPVDANKAIYSHRIYELLLRTATEFEANCKGILLANGYSKRGMLNITDYHKINSIMRLHEYKVYTPLWSPNKTTNPLSGWKTGPTLSWYQAYNKVKHNRFKNFKDATLENLYNGICSLLVILAAQFPNVIGDITTNGYLFLTDDDNSISFGGFTINYPVFSDADKYDFDWNTLKLTPSPFAHYSF